MIPEQLKFVFTSPSKVHSYSEHFSVLIFVPYGTLSPIEIFSSNFCAIKPIDKSNGTSVPNFDKYVSLSKTQVQSLFMHFSS